VEEPTVQEHVREPPWLEEPAGGHERESSCRVGRVRVEERGAQVVELALLLREERLGGRPGARRAADEREQLLAGKAEARLHLRRQLEVGVRLPVRPDLLEAVRHRPVPAGRPGEGEGEHVRGEERDGDPGQPGEPGLVEADRDEHAVPPTQK
jgi:hypothetical protein